MNEEEKRESEADRELLKLALEQFSQERELKKLWRETQGSDEKLAEELARLDAAYLTQYIKVIKEYGSYQRAKKSGNKMGLEMWARRDRELLMLGIEQSEREQVIRTEWYKTHPRRGRDGGPIDQIKELDQEFIARYIQIRKKYEPQEQGE